MLCSMCNNTGKVPVVLIRSEGEIVAVSEMPCPDCGGYGIIHCCEGLQAQPEPVEENKPVK